MADYNRVEREMKVWQEREQRFEKLVPGTLKNNKPFIKDKLLFLESLSTRFARTATPDERLLLSALGPEKQDLRRTIYPSLLYRILRAIISPLRQRQQAIRIQKATEGNGSELSDLLSKMGFTEAMSQLSQQLKQGKEKFSIPVSYYASEKERMDVSLAFSRSQENGLYSLDGYKARLTTEGNDATHKEHYFLNSDRLVSQREAYNLLSGRALLLGAGHWMQFNLNDKDENGNYRVKNFKHDIDGNLDLKPMLISLGVSEKQVNSFAMGLERGDNMSLEIEKDGNSRLFNVEANPQQKKLNVSEHLGVGNDNDVVINKSPVKLKVLEKNADAAPLPKRKYRKGVVH